LSLLILTACSSAAAVPPTFTPAPRVVVVTLPPTLTRIAPTPFPSLTPPAPFSRTPDPTATPAPVLRQLTTGGCCTQPFWSPGSDQVWYVDRPSDTQPGGVWGVSVTGGEPQFITTRIGLYSNDGALAAYPEGGRTMIERLATGERWAVPAYGRAIQFAPDNAHIAWQVASSSLNFDSRLVEIWIANLDGSEARAAAHIIGGSLVGWFPDGQRVLVTGREAPAAEPFLSAINIADGAFTGIVRGAPIRGGLISPGGGWVAYQVAFSGEAARDGLWLVRTDGGQLLKLPLFGAYRWREEGQLLVAPLEAEAPSHRLAQFDAERGELSALTDPAHLPFRIAGGDWAPSPDGRRVVFVNALDRNLWLIELP
jgi:hypothetical protein